jgi:galactose oxidase-like protein
MNVTGRNSWSGFVRSWIVGLVLVATTSRASAQIEWSRATAASPSARRGHAMASSPDGRGVVLFGGLGSLDTAPCATWTWDGSAWRVSDPDICPSPRSGHRMVGDPNLRRVVLFGGRDARGQVLSDTWTWDGAAWGISDPEIRPPARAEHAMVGDPNLHRILLFGGLDARGVPLDDTWSWDGARWVAVGDPQIRPPARSGHAMAYDPRSRRILLFGGVDAQGRALDDTWLWDGSRWSIGDPNMRPQARSGHTLITDPAQGFVLLFGGVDGRGTAVGDPWTFDGTSWAPVAVGDPNLWPSPRHEHAVAFDDARGEIVLFGGDGAAGFVLQGDTWTVVPCGVGTVHASSGAPTNVLFVADSPGSPGTHEVRVPLGAPVNVRLDSAASSPMRYALWIWVGVAANPSELRTPAGSVIGCTVNPSPFDRRRSPQPHWCLRGARMPLATCSGVAELSSPATAPWRRTFSNGFRSPIVLTLQALLEDRSAPAGFATSNAVVLRVP